MTRALWLAIGGLLLAAGGGLAAEPVQALVETSDYAWGFSLRPEVKFTSIKGNATQLAGGLLGAGLSRALYLGLGGYGLVNSVSADDHAVRIRAFDLWYAGAHADYTLLHAKILHGSLSGFVGGGQVRNSGPAETASANLFVAEPSVNLELNLTPSLELGLGGGYRIVNGSDLDRLSNSDLRGWVATLFLRWTEI